MLHCISIHFAVFFASVVWHHTPSVRATHLHLHQYRYRTGKDALLESRRGKRREWPALYIYLYRLHLGGVGNFGMYKIEIRCEPEMNFPVDEASPV